MNQCNQRLCLLTLLDGMMMADDFDDIVTQFPFLSQGLAGLAVRKPHSGEFRLVQRNPLLARAFHGRGKFLGKYQAVDHESQVMQQPRHISLLCIDRN